MNNNEVRTKTRFSIKRKDKPPKEKVIYELYKNFDGEYKKVKISAHELADFVEDYEDRISVDVEEGGENSSENKSKTSKIIGLLLAVVCGFFWGINLLPIIRIQDDEINFPNAPKNGLPYVFSHFCGAFITSSLGFFIYALIKRKKMEINPKITVPALISGLLWAIAETLLIHATSQLSVAITYPISVMLPGCIAALWSFFYFKEIEKGKNLGLLISAIFITLCGALCIGISK